MVELLESLKNIPIRHKLRDIGVNYVGRVRKNEDILHRKEIPGVSLDNPHMIVLFHGTQLKLADLLDILQKGLQTRTGLETFSTEGPLSGDPLIFCRKYSIYKSFLGFGAIFRFELPKSEMKETGLNRYGFYSSVDSPPKEILVSPTNIKGCWLVGTADICNRDAFYLGKNPQEVVEKLIKIDKIL